MLDIYCYGVVKRISPEAPVPILRKGENSFRFVAGGAANVAVNLVADGCEVSLFSVVGKDEYGNKLMKYLADNDIKTEYIVYDEKRPTTSKLRYIGQNNQQIFRVDEEQTTDVEYKIVEEDLNRLSDHINQYALLLLSDYKKGFLSYQVTQNLIRIANENEIPVLVDVKDTEYIKYKNATLLKPNRDELHLITGMDIECFNDVVSASSYLCRETLCQYVLTTMGADGMILTDVNGLLKKISSTAKEVYDVTGAGDTTIAYLAAEIAKGQDIYTAMEAANCAAGIQVSKAGTSIVYPEELTLQKDTSLLKRLSMYEENGLARLESERKKQRKIVFTNGCFDIVHAGHVDYLRKAREMGDLLVVGLNTDNSVKRIKGQSRPVNILEDRIKVLSAFDFVDFVIPFEEDTPMKLVQLVKPDVLVKGGDYKEEDIVGADFVKQFGGTVWVIPLLPDRSTTNIIKKIKPPERI